MVAGIFTEGNYVMEIDSWLLQFIHRFLFISSKFCKDSQEKKKFKKARQNGNGPIWGPDFRL